MKSLSRALAFVLPFCGFTFGAHAALAQAVSAPPAAPAAQPPTDAKVAVAASPEASSAATDDVDAAKSDEPVVTPPSPDELRDRLRFHAGPVVIKPVVLMQVQALPYVGEESFLQSGDAADRAGFRLRRARFGFEGRAFRRVPFGISAEFTSDDAGTARLHDAWFGYDRFKAIQVFAGAHTVPFSRSALTSAGNTALVDRPLAVRSMAPQNQLGVHLEGHLWRGALDYYAGVYNGLSRTDQFFEGFTENAAILGNRFEGLTYAGRLASAPLGRMGPSIQDLHHSSAKVGLGVSAFYSNGGTRDIMGIGGDALLHVAGVHVLAEFLVNRTTPTIAPTQPTTQATGIQSLAAVGEVGYMILRERLGVSARFEWLNPNTSVANEADSWLAGGGVSYHLFHDAVKAQLEYTHREEMHGKSLMNDSVAIQLQLHL